VKNRLPLFVIAGIGLVVVWYFVAFSPYLAQKRSLNSQLAEQRTLLSEFTSVLSQMPTAVQQNKELHHQVLDENSRLYARGDLLRLFADLRSKAGACGLHVAEISPPVSELLALNAQLSDSTAPQFLNMTVGLTGEFSQLAQFVTDLEHSPYFRGVNTCSINGQPMTPGQIQVFIGFRAMLGIVTEAS
jgi:hypothetical protein